ncbi:PREDICTED: LOW QUALITY PROTEIN: prohibitin-like [Mandrillus leucophaeus]|uniref:LOW QUALITY PROTEIN: prohibitin-like n=1 Tax=Mandrillus leucophaeus TaxID=9568 RepID=UPI0005F55A03|nr:PREDICTED: LOW QUALITY PROTEIN: prohibitin-like [Mandrillus leucophaeus]
MSQQIPPCWRSAGNPRIAEAQGPATRRPATTAEEGRGAGRARPGPAAPRLDSPRRRELGPERKGAGVPRAAGALSPAAPATAPPYRTASDSPRSSSHLSVHSQRGPQPFPGTEPAPTPSPAINQSLLGRVLNTPHLIPGSHQTLETAGPAEDNTAAKMFESIDKFGLALAVEGGVVNSALYNVDAGHRAVLFDRFRGVQAIEVGKGTHFLTPWLQKPVIFDCRSQPRNVPVITGSKDLQNVNITLRITFRPVASQLPPILTRIGEDHDERVLPSITTEILKSVVARFEGGELITHRELISRQLSDDRTERAASFGLILDDASLTHLTLGKEFIGGSQTVAQQEAERARFVVEKAEQQKKAAITSAEGDSKAVERITNSLATAGDALIELCKLETAEDIAYQFLHSRNIIYLPAGRSVPCSCPNEGPPCLHSVIIFFSFVFKC